MEISTKSNRLSNRSKNFIYVNFNKVKLKQQICLSVTFSICMIPGLKLPQFRARYTLGSGLPLKFADFLENISTFQIRELLMIFFSSPNHFAN